jgi:hypothetical protein
VQALDLPAGGHDVHDRVAVGVSGALDEDVTQGRHRDQEGQPDHEWR